MADPPYQRPKFLSGAKTALISHINPVTSRHVSLRALPKNLSASACLVKFPTFKQLIGFDRVTDQNLYILCGLAKHTD